eukprot:282406-Prymnesium_polylepis.1
MGLERQRGGQRLGGPHLGSIFKGLRGPPIDSDACAVLRRMRHVFRIHINIRMRTLDAVASSVASRRSSVRPCVRPLLTLASLTEAGPLRVGGALARDGDVDAAGGAQRGEAESGAGLQARERAGSPVRHGGCSSS